MNNVEDILDERANVQKELYKNKRKRKLPDIPIMHDISLFILAYYDRKYPKGIKYKEKVKIIFADILGNA